MIEERVPVINHARGNPDWLIKATEGTGIKTIPTVGALGHAMRAEQSGAEAIIVQGLEGGGHTSYVATMVLLPLVASKVKIPVVAAGGFCDGRGLAAALALGAEGICMGTRFALTEESGIPWNIKQRLLRASEVDTFVTTHLSGYPLRLMKNKLTDFLEKEGQKFSWREKISSALETRRTLGVSWWRFLLGGWRMRKTEEASFSDLASEATAIMRTVRALSDGDEDFGAMPCGQVCGLIDDIPTVSQIIKRTVAEAENAVRLVRGKLEP
jgi:NAD(P)H-dependent flavin oxidoreductase YrpB (nitropropane dioxygenase family)